MIKKCSKICVFLIIFFIRFYRICISPLIYSSCRYIPHCSEYAIIAFKKYGIFKGTWLSLKRISRCNPFGGSGYDPLPPNGLQRD